MICCFKNNLLNFDLSTQKSQKFALWLVLSGNIWPKKYRGMIFLGTREWFKIWNKTNLWFGKYMRNLANFHQSTWKSQNWDFDGILLSKVENVWTENLQGSYVSWQLKMMQKSKRNWLVNSKLTWGIWRSLTRALENLKNLHFNGLPLTKVYNVWPKKVQGSYVWWHWILMQNLKENWLLLSKMTWGIWEVFTRGLESLKIGILMGFFYLK